MDIKRLFSLLVLSSALLFASGMQAQTVNQKMQQQSTDIEVSDQELENFADASKEIQMLQYQMQSKLMELVKNSSMSVERFKEISRKQQQGQKPQLTEQEKKTMSGLQQQYRKEQQAMKPKMDSILDKYSLDQKRFMAISRAMRTDKELQKRLKEIQKK